MQSWKRGLGAWVSAGYAIKGTISGVPTGLRILMYHSVSKVTPTDYKDIYSITASRFSEHINCLSENHMKPSFFVKPFSSINDCGVAITFDDGYRDNLEIAAPVLIEHGFPFHIFINPTFIMSNQRKYLDTDGLREIAGLPGVTIGAHGFSHRKLTECSPTELQTELQSSKEWIEDRIGYEVNTMAYPHGAHNQKVRIAAELAGFKLAASSNFGISNTSSDPFALERTDIWAQDTTRAFYSKLKGHWDWMKYWS